MAVTVRPPGWSGSKMLNGHNAPAASTCSSSLLFELEVDDQQPRPRKQKHETRRALRLLCAPQSQWESRLLQDVRRFKAAVLKEEGSLDMVVLATRLAAVGYRVSIRTAVGGGAGQDCFHNLHYAFLLVTGEASYESTEYIVDPCFGEQFLISQPTDAYSELLGLLPTEFVGTAARLAPLVKLLCGEMAIAFQTMGLTCPPWRHANSMTSKWIPTKMQDVEVGSPKVSSYSGEESACSWMSPTTPLQRLDSGARSTSGTSTTGTSGRGSSALNSGAFSRQKIPSIPAHPHVRTAGFKPSSLLSSGLCSKQTPTLAAEMQPRRGRSLDSYKDVYKERNLIKDAFKVADAIPEVNQSDSSVDSWQQPRIRTVKLGRTASDISAFAYAGNRCRWDYKGREGKDCARLVYATVLDATRRRRRALRMQGLLGTQVQGMEKP